MADLNMESKFLAELTEEQQEVVSGGISVKDLINTTYSLDKETLAFAANSVSGPGGSQVNQAFAAENIEIFTSGSKDFTFDSDYGDIAVY